jgi:hypothetical protein
MAKHQKQNIKMCWLSQNFIYFSISGNETFQINSFSKFLFFIHFLATFHQ